jgi:serine phosphatase RsbU (regulator of sigma subunit)
MNDPKLIAVVLAVVVFLVWAIVLALRHGRRQATTSRAGLNEAVLTEFVVRSLDLHAFGDVLADATATAQAAFGASSGVVFEPGAKEGTWDAWAPGSQPTPLEPVPDAGRPVFAWLKHNAEVIALDEVAGPRFGAMRIPLSDLKARYGIDTLVPLVDRRQTIGAIGLQLGRRPTQFERSLLEHLRIEATAAAANVRLHREAAHKLTLEKEVDLASAVQRALVPAIHEASGAGLSWVGHTQFSGQAGSDFWCTYSVSGGKLLVVIGDMIGSGLAGSMLSAVAKSCCDAFQAAGTVDPGALLTALNHALYRPQRPIHMTGVVALFDPVHNIVHWANAGHPMPYFAAAHEHRLNVLTGSGPMLGDVADAHYVTQARPLHRGDSVLLYTDGLVEAMNLQRMPFGERRLQRALTAARSQPPAKVRDVILAAVEEFRTGAPISDDELLVYVRAS